MAETDHQQSSEAAPPELTFKSQAEAAPSEQAAPKATETIPSLEELLREAELKVQEHHDAWLRAKAETDNVRKRAQVDIAAGLKYALENFVPELLPVKDSLEAALSTTAASAEALRSGIELTLKQLCAALEKSNLKEINPLGEKFDPHRHQAVAMVDADAEPGTVVAVMQKGYLLHDRVVRPALVSVAKAGTA